MLVVDVAAMCSGLAGRVDVVDGAVYLILYSGLDDDDDDDDGGGVGRDADFDFCCDDCFCTTDDAP